MIALGHVFLFSGPDAFTHDGAAVAQLCKHPADAQSV